MGKFDFYIDPEFLKQLGKMSDIDRLAPQMIDEAIPILEKHVKREVSKHRQTGDLERSIKVSKAKKTKNGGYIASVHPSGVDSKGVRNMEKMVYLEYGTSKQPPRPTLTKALNDAETPVYAKMQEVFNREVGGE
jgi:HK97 gp10 family phage protein